MKPFLHVAVGVVYNQAGQILLTQRPAHKHEGGKWEFAGGKVEPGETVQEALSREFMEELGIKPTKIAPLIQIPYEYTTTASLREITTASLRGITTASLRGITTASLRGITTASLRAVGEAIQKILSRLLRACGARNDAVGNNDALGCNDLGKPLNPSPHKILLDVFEIFDFEGEPTDNEGQNIRWVSPQDLNDYEFPAANFGIIRAVQLPSYYLITPENETSLEEFIQHLRVAFQKGIKLCRVRQGSLSDEVYRERVQAASLLAEEFAVRLVVDFGSVTAGAYHLTSEQLYHYQSRPVPEDILLIASVHHEADLDQANRLRVDASTLSPVQPTLTHPEAEPLGWDGFAQLVSLAQHPVYALGGLGMDDLAQAKAVGGQGISAIRGFDYR